MNGGGLRRRGLLALLAATASRGRAEEDADDVAAWGRLLRFPRDHGAHLRSQTEWWYATGWLQPPAGAPFGFQITFFRQRTGLAEALTGRFVPKQLLFAHAALSDAGAARHRHAQRIARWSGAAESAEGHASREDAQVSLGRWRLARADGRYHADMADEEAGFGLDLQLAPTQAPLLQGERGSVRKGPRAAEFGHYYSEPQLAVSGRLRIDGRSIAAEGRGWLDHEWSDTPLPAGAVGWDWIGINLDDGSALMAIQMRAADGGKAWAGGSFRRRGGEAQAFEPEAVRFEAGRRWQSPLTGARYPVQWTVTTPAGRFRVRALFDAQELDSRASTGAVYWEGMAELADDTGRTIGRGYLEMTGYVEPLRLG